jgi:hypothetical protein
MLTKNPDMFSVNPGTQNEQPGATTTVSKRKRKHKSVIEIEESDTEQKVPPKKTKTTPTKAPETHPPPPPPTEAQRMERAALEMAAQNQVNIIQGGAPGEFQTAILKSVMAELAKEGMWEKFAASGLVSSLLPPAAVQQPQPPIQVQPSVSTELPPSQQSENAEPPTQPQAETEEQPGTEDPDQKEENSDPE